MKFNLEFNMDNAAFEMPYDEAARILKAIAAKLEGRQGQGSVVDSDGNKVGTWKIIEG